MGKRRECREDLLVVPNPKEKLTADLATATATCTATRWKFSAGGPILGRRFRITALEATHRPYIFSGGH